MDTHRAFVGTIFGIFYLLVANSKLADANGDCFAPRKRALEHHGHGGTVSCSASSQQDFKNFTITGWEESSTRWEVVNKDNTLEITFSGGYLLTNVKYLGRDHRILVDRIVIAPHGFRHVEQRKLRKKKKKAEMQLYHKNHEVLGRHAFTFFLGTRSAVINKGWAPILRRLRKSRKVSIETKLFPDFRTFLHGENSNSRYLQRYLRYRDVDLVETTAPCHPYTWRVFNDPVILSQKQMQRLTRILHRPSASKRHIEKEVRIPSNTYCVNRRS